MEIFAFYRRAHPAGTRRLPLRVSRNDLVPVVVIQDRLRHSMDGRALPDLHTACATDWRDLLPGSMGADVIYKFDDWRLKIDGSSLQISYSISHYPGGQHQQRPGSGLRCAVRRAADRRLGLDHGQHEPQHDAQPDTGARSPLTGRRTTRPPEPGPRSMIAGASCLAQNWPRAYPIRLKPEDWTGGETAWLLDVIAPSQRVATAVLKNFRQVVRDRPVRVHPVVAQLVDP